jgi:hypothetical protein
MDRIKRPAISLRAKRFEKLAMVRGAQPRHDPPIKMCKVIETVDLDSRKDVLCTWFVISRKRSLFGPSGSLGVGYAQVIDDYRSARTRLNASTTIEPVELPIPNGSKSLEAQFNERGTAKHDDSGNELDFAVACYHENGAGSEADCSGSAGEDRGCVESVLTKH